MKMFAKASPAHAQFVCQRGCMWADPISECSGGTSQKYSWKIEITPPEHVKIVSFQIEE